MILIVCFKLAALVSWNNTAFAYASQAQWTNSTTLLITVLNPTLGWSITLLQV